MTIPASTNERASSRELRSAYEACGEIVRQRARNFWYGLKLTPEPKRSALYAIYAWMRAVDDLADEPGPSASDRRASLERFREGTMGIFDGRPAASSSDDSWWIAFADVVRTHSLDPEPFEGMIEGQLLDLEWTTCPDRQSLDHFCRLVASTVGTICIRIWGHEDHPEVPARAEARGIALQLTNILRDLREDLERGRVYLPADELEHAGLGIDDLLEWRDADRCDAFMRAQVARARSHYLASEGLESHLDPSCRATSWAMCQIYRGILDRIEADPGRVIRERVRLGSLRKAGIAWKARRMARSPRNPTMESSR